jgi:omega-hydroxy-beta-dihydromenaquinone-9 sulfotransferase
MAERPQQRHPFVGVALGDWIRTLIENGGVSPSRVPEALRITALSALFTGPRLYERVRWHGAVEATELSSSPIFVIGHWRSGTTFLQNVLSKDPAFAHLSVIQSVFPNAFLTCEPFLTRRMPTTTREMDNVELAPASPSEEEVAMAVLGRGSFWHGYYFPRRMDHYFRKYMLFEGISPAELDAWKRAYVHLLKKLTLRNGGRQLLLKNPPNTSRIEVLLDLFPDAKFVHIYRNPFEVYLSRMAQYKTSVVQKALQPISEAEWESRVLAYYREIMRKHFRERSRIPEGNYVEVRFEEFRAAPLKESERVYEALGLGGFGQARPHLEAYLATLRGYKQNRYGMEPDVLDRVYEHWGFTIDQWGYEMARV